MGSWYLPRFDRRRAVLATAFLTPPVMLAALANALTFLGLAQLDIPDLGDRQTFKEQAELLDMVLFVVLGVGTFVALHVAQEPLKGLHYFTVATLAFLVAAVRWEWTFGLSADAARLGLGIALWGLGWVFVSLHLIALLRTIPHRKWVFVTGAVGLFLAVSTIAAIALGDAWGLDAVADLFLIAGILAAVIVHFQWELAVEWGYRRLPGTQLPAEDVKRSILVPVYGLTLFGLIGAQFAHHFDYGRLEAVHYITLFAAFAVAVPVFGLVMEKAGRRALLYTVPVLIGLGFVLQASMRTPWPLMLVEGLIIGSIAYLLQYFVEVSRRLSRTVVYMITMGAVAAMGAGGSLVAQFQAFTGFGREQLLIVELAGLLVVFALAPLVPDTIPEVTEEEDIQDYLELARRVQDEARS